MSVLDYVLTGAIIALTVALWRSIGFLYVGIELPPKPRRALLKRTLRTVGVWQITIGGFLVSQGGWVNSVSLFVIGIAFVLVPNVMVGGTLTPRPGEAPDLRDPEDVERWLREQDS